MPVNYSRRGRGARVATSWVRGSRSRVSAPNKWRRPQEVDSTPGMLEGSSSNPANSMGSSSREVNSPSTSMVKRGSYQLVSKTKGDNNETMDLLDPNNPTWTRSSPTRGRKRKLGGHSSPHHSMTLWKGQNTWKSTTGVVRHENDTDSKPSAKFLKHGSHQLVLNNKNTTKNAMGDARDYDNGEGVSIPSTVHQHHPTKESTKEGDKQGQREKSCQRPTALKKIGSHKMVLDGRTSHMDGTQRQVIPKDQYVDDQRKVQKQSLPPLKDKSKESLGRGTLSTHFDVHNSHSHNRPMPKRIRLTTTDTGTQELLENEGKDNNRAHSALTKDSHERLSKFAYCEIGRKGPRRHMNRTLNTVDSQAGHGGSEQPRKMGLVRANRTDNAPICPFYAKGVDCTDRFCQKRHDVPIESAVPVCSFFQRNGQCLKENCRFRHIKINPQAAVCPAFALLGYCENEECTMKHVMGASQPTHSSKTIQRKHVDT